MTHDDDARVADLLARLGDGDSKELFRRLLETGMQELIDAELTAAILQPSNAWPFFRSYVDGCPYSTTHYWRRMSVLQGLADCTGLMVYDWLIEREMGHLERTMSAFAKGRSATAVMSSFAILI